MPPRLFTARQWSKYLPYFEVEEMGSSYFSRKTKRRSFPSTLAVRVCSLLLAKRKILSEPLSFDSQETNNCENDHHFACIFRGWRANGFNSEKINIRHVKGCARVCDGEIYFGANIYKSIKRIRPVLGAAHHQGRFKVSRARQ